MNSVRGDVKPNLISRGTSFNDHAREKGPRRNFGPQSDAPPGPLLPSRAPSILVYDNLMAPLNCANNSSLFSVAPAKYNAHSAHRLRGPFIFFSSFFVRLVITRGIKQEVDCCRRFDLLTREMRFYSHLLGWIL